MQKNLFIIPIVFLALAVLAVGCSKVEDPPIPVGKALAYTSSSKPTETMLQLFDSLPQTTIYKAAWHRADLQQYIDSLRGIQKDSLLPFTLFIPTDAAFKQAGVTLDTINNIPVAQLDSLLRYLAIPGIITYDTMPFTAGSTTYYPLMDPNPAFETPGLGFLPYQYKLTVGAYNNTLYLNGKSVGGHTTPTRATDGSIFLLDSVVSRPMPYTTAQLLQADTSFSFYLAACSISDSIYNYQYEYGLPYDDTSYLYFNSNNYPPAGDGWAEVFAPDNNAFRRAGFYSIDSIRNYINTSALALEDPFAWPFILMPTNMDSILVNHRLLNNQYANGSFVNTGLSYIYAVDMLYNPAMQALNNGYELGAITFQNSSGQVIIHRQDYPGGRAAHIVGPEITTLTGVLYRVDNLLLPTP